MASNNVFPVRDGIDVPASKAILSRRCRSFALVTGRMIRRLLHSPKMIFQ